MLPLSQTHPHLTHEYCMAVGCPNEARALCSECLKAAYCSSLCLNSDWGDHQNFCRKSGKRNSPGRTAKEISIISSVGRLLEKYCSRECSTPKMPYSEENIAFCKRYLDEGDISEFLSRLWRIFPDPSPSVEEDLASSYARLLEEGMFQGNIFCASEYLVFLATLFVRSQADEERESILIRACATELLVSLCEQMDLACCSSYETVRHEFLIIHNTYDRIINEASSELLATMKTQDRGLVARYFVEHFSHRVSANAPTSLPPTWLNQTGIKAAFLAAECFQPNSVFTGNQLSKVREEVIKTFLLDLEAH